VVRVERANLGIRRLVAVAEDQLDVRVRSNCRRAIDFDGADVHAFMNCQEQARERRSPFIHGVSMAVSRRRFGCRSHRLGARDEFAFDSCADLLHGGA